MAQRTNTDTGKPSGVNKSQEGTGVPSVVNDDNLSNDERLSQAYTRDDEGIKEGVREMHPNRNVAKDDNQGH